MEKNINDVFEYWQKTPQLFSQAYCSDENYFVNRFLKKRLKVITSLFRIQPEMQVMDVGCGSGIYSQFLIQLGASIIALDYSKEMLISCQNALNNFDNSKFLLLQGDTLKLPISEKKIDLLIAIGLLDYISDIETVLQEYFRVIKPGGQIIFTIPKRISPFFLLRMRNIGFLRRNIFKLPYLVTTMTKKQLKKITEKNGFSIKRISSFYMTMWIFEGEKNSIKIA